MGARSDCSGREMRTGPPPNDGTADELATARRVVAERGLTGAGNDAKWSEDLNHGFHGWTRMGLLGERRDRRGARGERGEWKLRIENSE